jgi:hypothetical protein
MIAARKSRTLAALLIIFAATVCEAQKNRKDAEPKPDFSGTWILDESQSFVRTDSGRISDYTLTIEHREPEIKMAKRFKVGNKDYSIDTIYYTDGRPEYDSQAKKWDSSPEIKWSGKKLVRRTRVFAELSARIQIVTDEIWSLSEDGQTLTRSIETYGPGALSQKRKSVFRRAAADRSRTATDSKGP